MCDVSVDRNRIASGAIRRTDLVRADCSGIARKSRRCGPRQRGERPLAGLGRCGVAGATLGCGDERFSPRFESQRRRFACATRQSNVTATGSAGQLSYANIQSLGMSRGLLSTQLPSTCVRYTSRCLRAHGQSARRHDAYGPERGQPAVTPHVGESAWL